MGRYFVLFLLLLAGTKLRADERYEFFTGVRQNGMGGASVAVANDETALLANPATLGKLRTYIVTLVDPELSVGDSDVAIMGQNSYSDMLLPQPLLNATAQNAGRHWHAKAQLFPSVVITNFGLGVFGKQEYNAETDATTNKFKFDYTYDLALALGYGIRLFDGRIKIGASGRYINRAEAHESVDSSTTNLDMANIVKEGGGVAADVGVVLTAPWIFLPSLAAVWRDVGHTTFTLNDGLIYKSGRYPEQVHQTVDAAFAIFPIHQNHIRSTFTVEYQDVLTYSEETDQMRRLHLGVELNLYDMIFLRGGMNQRYWTAGCEFAFRYLQIQGATYGEEIGTVTSPKEDRRIIGKLSFRF